MLEVGHYRELNHILSVLSRRRQFVLLHNFIFSCLYIHMIDITSLTCLCHFDLVDL